MNITHTNDELTLLFSCSSTGISSYEIEKRCWKLVFCDSFKSEYEQCMFHYRNAYSFVSAEDSSKGVDLKFELKKRIGEGEFGKVPYYKLRNTVTDVVAFCEHFIQSTVDWQLIQSTAVYRRDSCLSFGLESKVVHFFMRYYRCLVSITYWAMIWVECQPNMRVVTSVCARFMFEASSGTVATLSVVSLGANLL